MPFDGRNYEPERKEPSLEGLIEWLEGQEPGTSYDYTDPRDCLCCRYFRAAGFDVRSFTRCTGLSLKDGTIINVPDELSVAAGAEEDPSEWHVNAALQRAHALLRETVAAE